MKCVECEASHGIIIPKIVSGAVDEWVLPISYVDPDTVWWSETQGYDSIITMQDHATTKTSGSYLELIVASAPAYVLASKIKVMAVNYSLVADSFTVADVDIDEWDAVGGAWINIHSGPLSSCLVGQSRYYQEISLGSLLQLQQLRIKSNDALSNYPKLWLYDMQVYKHFGDYAPIKRPLVVENSQGNHIVKIV